MTQQVREHPSADELVVRDEGKQICIGCAVRGVHEHKCLGNDGVSCDCDDVGCRLHRGEITLDEAKAETGF